ncbi:DUF6457 domain-containing protein [Rhodococcus sp. T2V]|uniref:DUF6457 domain-containing protein n=1 Tax=Rhodococcus sp. T2V TaxID=3034164 RepID=UPI0023E27BD6|nr:DUF6457 domain-containing protein [Rhodococcus sp. T2V]MDF3313576.1 DUF6457 domain-containing protein [Rhodococcus sp. T2V]
MTTLDTWIAAVTAELDVDELPDQQLLLDFARDIAHLIEHQATPLTTYLAGIAIGAGADPTEVLTRIHSLAVQWNTPPPE